MSDLDESKKLLDACDDMLAFHRRNGTSDGAAAQEVAEKRREVEERLAETRGDGDPDGAYLASTRSTQSSRPGSGHRAEDDV
jgi:hypothetical protein